MPTPYQWTLIGGGQQTGSGQQPISPIDRAIQAPVDAFLGRGIFRPFQRDQKNDVANTSGEDLVKACVGQVLGTMASSDFTQGEVPWRTEFGSLLHLLKHQKNNVALQEMARVYVVDALKRWEPRVRVKSVQTTREVVPGAGEAALVIRLRYDIITSNVPGNEVFVPDVTQTVKV